MKLLDPRQELDYLKEIYGGDQPGRILQTLIESYNVLQGRAQTLLGVVTIILTIAGFSGPTIAASGIEGKLGVGVGLTLVIVSAVITLRGPLQLRWATQSREESMEASLIALIAQRNFRTRRYHAAVALLVAGLTVYVAGLVSYVFRL